MAISESISVCKALDILVDASPDDLEPHWSKATDIFQKLRRRMRTKSKKPTSTTQSSTVIGNNERTSSPPDAITSTKDSHFVSTSLTQPQNTSGESARSENQAILVHGPPRHSGKVDDLVQSIAIEKLRTFINATKPTKERFRQKGPTIDVRITDIVSVTGRRDGDDVCNFDQLRRGLAAWSIASEYVSWRDCHRGSVCVLKRWERSPSSPETYINITEKRFGLEYKGTLRYAIRCGKALLDYEQWFEGSGYLAILFFCCWDNSIRLSTEHKKELVEALQSKNDISKFAEDAKEWVDQWRRVYDGESPTSLY